LAAGLRLDPLEEFTVLPRWICGIGSRAEKGKNGTEKEEGGRGRIDGKGREGDRKLRLTVA